MMSVLQEDSKQVEVNDLDGQVIGSPDVLTQRSEFSCNMANILSRISR